MPGTDILVVSLGTTGGWRAAASELASGLGRAGVSVEVVSATPSPEMRTFALTDLVQAWATRRAARAGIAAYAPSAVIYCSMTAALLWPAPGGLWLDSIAAENRPGRHGIWQRATERRRLLRAPLVLTMSAHSLDPLRGRHAPALVLPIPVDPSGPAVPAPERDLAAIAYAGDPLKKRLDVILEAWAHTRRAGETLVVAGTDEVPRREGVRGVGRLARADYRALLRRARVFVAAPRREDYGIAPLEALADGCILVSTPAPGPYPALELAMALDPRFVSDDLAGALRLALDEPLTGYAERAAALLCPFSRSAFDRALSQEVLPRLLPGWCP